MRPLAVTLLLVLAGCSFFSGPEGAEPNYASEADENMRRGRLAMQNKSFVEAGKYFEHVRTKFPFLEAANDAELGLADSEFERELYTEARERYENFVKLHPSHARADYAAYRAALAHYREVPGDF